MCGGKLRFEEVFILKPLFTLKQLTLDLKFKKIKNSVKNVYNTGYMNPISLFGSMVLPD
jgi:hypothetical protein